MNWALLSKEERRELAKTIDYILDFLLFVPVRKEAGPERHLFGSGAEMAATEENIGKVEQKLAQVLLEGWNAQAQKAINKGAALLQSFEGDIDEKEIKLLLSTIAREMGSGFQAMTQEQVTNLVGTAYILGRKLVGQQVGIEPKLDLIDERARQWLADHTVFWIGDYYDSQLGENIASTVRQLALEQGLGREEVGRQLKAVLGDQFARSDVYWRGLAATTVGRARNFGGVQSMVEAQVSEYEILAVMDERTSPICRFMNGKVFKVEHAVALRDAVLNAKMPEDIKAIHPWRQVKEVQSWSTEKLAAGGMALPPYHFHCFPPGTTVMTIDGPRPIEQIAEGDLVLTHIGRWKPVTATMVRPYEGELIVVNGQITSTLDHPYLALTTNGIEWLPAIRLENCSLLQVVLQSQWKPGGESHDQQNMPDMRQGVSSFSIPQPREILFARVSEPGESEGVYWADQGKTLSSSQGDPGVPAMRERISGSREPGEAGQGHLLQQRVQGQSSGYQSCTGLCGLRETVSEEQSLSGKGLWEILLPGLSEQGQERGKALQVERRDQNRQEGVYIRVPSRSSLCQQPGVCAATPPCNGEVVGTIPRSRRSGSSQERHSDGQQAREPDALLKQLGAPGIPQGARHEFQWIPVVSLERQRYRGPVYNLEVEDDESYFANGFAVHNCRTTYIVSAFGEAIASHEPLDIKFEQPKPKSELPSMDHLDYVGSGAYLGGSGQKFIYQGPDGQQYIFKPAVSKGASQSPSGPMSRRRPRKSGNASMTPASS
ncbi:MAG: minor capsid protein [Syntrophothermus sp.]|nr:minor capsid protein [Syntrophothermus sp.]NSW82541.1 minor capsid protein [Syntrophothermus sp.]